MHEFDAIVVGAGPNGLSAAIELARSGLKVHVVEAADEIGGGTRTAELTLPGFYHDVCSAIHPTAVASPFFKEIDLEVDWIHSPIPFTHPLDGGRAIALYRSVEETAAQLGADEGRYVRLMKPFVEKADAFVDEVLGTRSLIPRHLGLFARIAANGGMPAMAMAGRFRTEEGKALIAGLAAHAIAPFSTLATSGVALTLGALAHAVGWPLARGGSKAISIALAARFEALGGTIEVGRRIESVDELPARIILLDLMPDSAAAIAGQRIGPSSSRRLSRWKPGAGIFKVDWALDGPIPWANPSSVKSATVHVGGTYRQIQQGEKTVFAGGTPDRPFVLVAQQSLFDATRAPEGKQTAWGYCHVPNGSATDMTGVIEAQIERFAPGFKSLILDRSTLNSAEYQAYNANYVGGDIGGGSYGARRVLQFGDSRPFAFGNGVFLCSSATPPGPGVHGMCGYLAARSAMDSLGKGSKRK